MDDLIDADKSQNLKDAIWNLRGRPAPYILALLIVTCMYLATDQRACGSPNELNELPQALSVTTHEFVSPQETVDVVPEQPLTGGTNPEARTVRDIPDPRDLAELGNRVSGSSSGKTQTLSVDPVDTANPANDAQPGTSNGSVNCVSAATVPEQDTRPVWRFDYSAVPRDICTPFEVDYEHQEPSLPVGKRMLVLLSAYSYLNHQKDTLAAVLHSIASWRAALDLDITLIIDTVKGLPQVPFLNRELQMSVRVLRHPNISVYVEKRENADYALTIQHRCHIDAAIAADNRYDWIMYTEDDLNITSAALRTAIRHVSLRQDAGEERPAVSFLRVETVPPHVDGSLGVSTMDPAGRTIVIDKHFPPGKSDTVPPIATRTFAGRRYAGPWYAGVWLMDGAQVLKWRKSGSIYPSNHQKLFSREENAQPFGFGYVPLEPYSDLKSMMVEHLSGVLASRLGGMKWRAATVQEFCSQLGIKECAEGA